MQTHTIMCEPSLVLLEGCSGAWRGLKRDGMYTYKLMPDSCCTSETATRL